MRLETERLQVENERRKLEALRVEQLRLESEARERARARAAAIEREAMQTGQSNNAGVPDLLERLRELGKLKDAGYLTEEEFQLIKKKVIASQT